MCVCVCLTAVLGEALVADLAEALEGPAEVPHLLLQVRVFLVQHVFLGVALQGRDLVLVYF